MNGLYQFLEFNFNRFTEGKVYRSGEQLEWIKKDSDEVLGTKVPAIIWLDNTPYKKTKKGKTISNQYEKVVFKVPKRITIPPNVQIQPVNPVATVYGDYQNNLSIVCDDIRVIQAKKQ